MTRLLGLLAMLTVAAVVLPGSAAAADLFVAPAGAGAACSSGAPCASLDAAYRAAQPGDVVELSSGRYGRQTVPAVAKAGPAIEFRAAPGADVVVAGIDIKADNVVMRGMTSDSFLDVDSSPTDPVEGVRLYDMHTKTHWINNARDFVWTGGSIGPSFNVKASMVGGQPASQRLTYDGIYWHDATRDNQGVHMECFYVASVQGITIRNSRFRNCAVFDILFTKLGSDPSPSNIVVENTVFERSKDVAGDAYYTFMVHENAAIDGFVLRNNVWELGFSILGSVSNARAVGNIGRGSCQPGVTYRHNVFVSAKCGPTDKVAGNAFSQFVNPAAGDWRLAAGAAAVDSGDPADFPALDASGHARPAGGAPDAGPYEFGAGPPSGGSGPPAGNQPPSPRGTGERKRARVLKVVDGRTLRVRMKSGKRRTVRLLGIDISQARRCGGPSTTSRLRAFTPAGSQIAVKTDKRVAARDARGRMLAYVSRSRHDIGKALISRGWARVSGARNIGRLKAYKTAQRKASRQSLGLWRCG